MAGLYEGGNEPTGSLKAIVNVSLDWRTELHTIDGALRGLRYAEEMVRECISNRRNIVGQENFIFLDNARSHRAAVVMEALEYLQINHLPLPPRSPDLNAIEHVWDCFRDNLTTIYHTQLPSENLQR
ncbi:hypothetical protein ANN_21373 [Periplaneta americana]|uniref:Tc1-like transposase DDE domain-containing protein n=1 Tax=Periplaneta americana TaxID=6978 RepID=A0ABQ8SGZ7_PERAM|nr:hypothetical protein ANN_21373 [Periplaneta americana]